MYNLHIIHVVLCVVTATMCWNFVEMENTKLIIDNDAGGDDAMAIFIALLNEKYYNGPELIALTTGNGNTKEDNVYINNQRILKIANREDIPIYRGNKESLVLTPETNNYYGLDGLGDNNFNYLDEDLVPAKKEHAVIKLIQLSLKHKKNLKVITIGTLTNIALAIKLDPLFLGRIGQLYVGAGHIHSEKHPEAEFNALMDPEAYHILAKHALPDKVTIVPFSQIKDYLNISTSWRENVLGAINTDIMNMQNKFERVAISKSDRWLSLDPAVAALVVNPKLVEEYKYAKNDILLCGAMRGINTNAFVEQANANVRVVYSAKVEKYKKFLLDLFSAEIVGIKNNKEH